jgi:integrase
MTKPNPTNERIKRDYLTYLRDARGRDNATIDGVAKALARFEESTRGKDFKRFHREQAMAFKARLAAAINARTGERLSKATVLSTVRDLRAFFFWLAHLPGFKSHIAYADADYFNLSDKDVAVARARREQRVPTLDQVRHVLAAMPAATALERRERALIAFAMLTGARIGALGSLRLGHVDVAGGYVDQDARAVRTKAAKTFRTYLMPVDDRALNIVGEWVDELGRDHLWGPSDPLFPATKLGLGRDGGFVPVGLARRGWVSTEPVRDIFRRAFLKAGLPYFNPHSFGSMLVRHAMTLDLSAEAMKAWSQNLGHADVLTTFTSYGAVPTHRQGELIQGAELEDDRARQCQSP